MSRTVILPLRIDLPDTNHLVYGPNNRQLTSHDVTRLTEMFWPPGEQANARAIAFAESAYWTGAWSYIGEDSRGLWQLDVDAYVEMEGWDLFDPQLNAYFAYLQWTTEGWAAWKTAAGLGLA